MKLMHVVAALCGAAAFCACATGASAQPKDPDGRSGFPAQAGPRPGPRPIPGAVDDRGGPDKGGYDLGIRKTGPGPLTAGQSASFTLNAVNNGPSAVTGSSGVTVTDTLPANFVGPVSASGAGWTCTVSGAGPYVVNCVYAGPAVGAGDQFPAITITASARGVGDYQNCASIGVRAGQDLKPGDNRACIGGVIQPGKGDGGGKGYDVGIRKSGGGYLTAGQTGSFTLNTINTGPAPVNASSGVTVTDVLPANFTGPVTASGSGWTCVVGGSGPYTVTCAYNGPTVNAGGAMPAITITAVARGAGDFNNCADIAVRSGQDLKPGDNRSCAPGNVAKGDGGGKGYDVGIRKAGPGPLTVGQTGSFTLNVLNNGPSPVGVGVGAGVSITDTLPANFSGPVTALGSGWNCSVSSGSPVTVDCVYLGPPVNAGGALPQIVITAVARTAGDYRNCADVGMRPLQDSKPGDNTSCVGGVISKGDGGGKGYDVGIRKSGGGYLTAGQTGSFTLNTINTGPAPVNASSGVTVTDVLPANFTGPVTASGSGWTCVVGGSGPYTVTCAYNGPTVNAGGAMPAITITAVARGAGDFNNCADIAVRAGQDLKPGDNRSCAPGNVSKGDGGKTINLSLSKDILNGPWTYPGGGVYRLTVRNVGSAVIPAGTQLVVADALPPGLKFTGAAAPWICAPIGAVGPATVTCSYTLGSPLGVNGSQILDLSVAFVGAQQPFYRNCAHLSSRLTETVQKDNDACVSFQPDTYDLSLDKRVVAGSWTYPGGGQFDLVVTNAGTSTIPAGQQLQIIENLPAGMKLISVSAPWLCTPATPVNGPASVACSRALSSPLPTGQSQTMQATVGFIGPQLATYQNCASAAAIDPRTGKPVPETNTGNNRDCETVTPKPASANLSIVKSVIDDCYQNHNGNDTQCTFRFTITNNASTSWTGVLQVTDVVQPQASSFVTLVGGQPVGWTCVGSQPMTCTSTAPVTLPAGASVSFDVTMTIASPIIPTQNCATLTGTTPSSCVPLGATTPAASLSVAKTLTTPCTPASAATNGAEVCTFQFVVTNAGPGTYTGPVTLVDTVSPAVAVSVNVLSPGWSCAGSPTVTCNSNVSLPPTGAATLQATFAITGPVPPNQNCVALTPQTGAGPFTACVPIVTASSGQDPQLSIEKVVDQDCTGSTPSTLCKFVIRVFNNGPGAYTGPLTFTDLVTSFGNTAGGVSLGLPAPSGWTCSGSQPFTCASNTVTIAQGSYLAAHLNLTINGAIPPDQNCATLTAPQMAGPSCVPIGHTHYDLLIDSNFMAVVGSAYHELSYYVSSTPQLLGGTQVIVNGSMTPGALFTPWTITSPGWSCSGSWTSFMCSTTLPNSYSGGGIVLKLRTTYATSSVGQAFTYVGTAAVNGNADPNTANNTRTVSGTLF